MGQHLAETTKLLAWRYANTVFAMLALIAASTAMAIPGPGSDITGFSAVLVVGALALLAGHAWGILVIATAELLIVGNILPEIGHLLASQPLLSARVLTSITAIAAALPGLLLFAATLPYMVEVIIGEKGSRIQRPGELATSAAALGWLLHPLVL